MAGSFRKLLEQVMFCVCVILVLLQVLWVTLLFTYIHNNNLTIDTMHVALKADGSASEVTKTISVSGVAKESRPLVAVVACVTAKRGLKVKKFRSVGNVSAMALSRFLLPSLIRTMERSVFLYELFLGVDDDDDFWTDAAHQSQLQRRAGSLQVHFRGFPSRDNRIPFNAILKVARDAGADFIVRVNDDSEFVTHKWTTRAVRKLASFDPPNVGVVGPTCRQGKKSILTHDFVHRTHMEIFNDTYYPSVFDAWFVDTWISRVYGPRRTAKLRDWEVNHHKNYHGTRYKHHEKQRKLVASEVKRGLSKITSWLNQHRVGKDPK